MSEKSIVEFKKGEADLSLDFKDGKVRLSVSYDGKGTDAGIYVDLEAEYFIDKLADAIPGTVDDMILSALKGALK